jgi:hypothetical protein
MGVRTEAGLFPGGKNPYRFQQSSRDYPVAHPVCIRVTVLTELSTLVIEVAQFSSCFVELAKIPRNEKGRNGD